MMKELQYLMVSLVLTMLGGCEGGDTTNPVFISDAEADASENQTSAITLRATDEESTVTITISGTDADSFDTAIATAASSALGAMSTTLIVTFKSAPDFEAKGTYTFTATATDSAGNKATQDVTITILNDNCTGGDEVWHLGIMYCTVTSPYGTHKVWLDRNLGAGKVCADFNDTECFGDYYQWGRNTDGHEKKDSNTTNSQASNINEVGHGKFITSDNTHHYDWAADSDTNGSKRLTNWIKTDGSNVCPVGYHVANANEFRAELFDENSSEIQKDQSQKDGNSDDRRINAYNTFLKLPSAGGRLLATGILAGKSEWGRLWVASASDSLATRLSFYEGSADLYSDEYRAHAFSVRCLRGNP
jgi:uncharacterized protein (TIGR02145 family)